MKTSLEDPQMKAVLDQLTALCGRMSSAMTVAEARQKPTPADAVKLLLRKQGRHFVPQFVGSVTNHFIDGPGGKIPIRIYAPQGDGPFPVIVYYHGGGWVIADLDTYDASPRALVNAAHAVVVSTHYRQAPEHPFPAAHEDALAAYQWALTHIHTIKGDPTKIAVVGESAGGNLAAAVCLMARDKGLPLPVHQVLICPVTNHGFDTPSYETQAHARPLSRAMMKWFFARYLKSPKDGRSPLISLLHAHPLKGLPPATIITAQLDPLRSEGKMFADKLQKAGVPVNYRNYKGMAHEFFGMGVVVDQANEAVQFAADGLRAGCNPRMRRAALALEKCRARLKTTEFTKNFLTFGVSQRRQTKQQKHPTDDIHEQTGNQRRLEHGQRQNQAEVGQAHG